MQLGGYLIIFILQLKKQRNKCVFKVTWTITCSFRGKTYRIPLSRTTVIPHVVLNREPADHKKADVLKIIHSGNINYPRDPELFLGALEQFFGKREDARLEVFILGVTGQDIEQKINAHSLQDHVHTIAPVSYNTSMEMLKEYDLAVIIEAKCDEGIFLPTKVSDFMQAGLPIFAISPETGVLNDLYRNGNIPYFASNEDMQRIGLEIERIYDDFENGRMGTGFSIPDSYTEESVTNSYLSF